MGWSWPPRGLGAVGRAAHLLRFCPSIRLRRAALPALHWFPLHVPHGSQAPALNSSAPSPKSPRLWIWAILFFFSIFPVFQSSARLPSPGPTQRGDVAPAMLRLLPVVPSAHNLPTNLCVSSNISCCSGVIQPSACFSPPASAPVHGHEQHTSLWKALICITGSDTAAHHTTLTLGQHIPCTSGSNHRPFWQGEIRNKCTKPLARTWVKPALVLAGCRSKWRLPPSYFSSHPDLYFAAEAVVLLHLTHPSLHPKDIII